jgi:hypothetical protein
MPRPRKFPTHSDSQPRLSAEAGRKYRPAKLAGTNPIDRKAARNLADRTARLSHPTPAGWCDPVSIALVLDAILRLEHDTTIRAGHLNDILNAEYPQVAWNPNTVGRILSELAEAAAATGAESPAIVRGLTRGGNRFAVNVDSLNWRWLYEVEKRMLDLAERVTLDERVTGKVKSRPSFPHDVVASVRWGAVAA